MKIYVLCLVINVFSIYNIFWLHEKNNEIIYHNIILSDLWDSSDSSGNDKKGIVLY